MEVGDWWPLNDYIAQKISRWSRGRKERVPYAWKFCGRAANARGRTTTK